ncbi:MAG: CocE/NonD family hydrolase, partial [candidate division Zixibacteria bacterium]|nr:CocE/NonD family hydrolase [candidate division Zixibacteria bacterium]
MDKYRKILCVLTVGFFVCVFLSSIGDSICEASAQKISRPFEYEGYSSPEYENFVKSSHYVSMYDGTKLAVDVYLPSEGPEARSFPVLLTYHPYKRAMIDPKTGMIKSGSLDMERFIRFFSSYGYGLVIAEMRGSGASYGSRLDVSPQLAKDGKQLVDWIETQIWCD